MLSSDRDNGVVCRKDVYGKTNGVKVMVVKIQRR